MQGTNQDLLAAVIFFFVVKPINALLALRRRESEPSPELATRDCPYCLNTIPQKATRCGFCTSEVTPEAQINVVRGTH